jgi:hypothetical protein
MPSPRRATTSRRPAAKKPAKRPAPAGKSRPKAKAKPAPKPAPARPAASKAAPPRPVAAKPRPPAKPAAAAKEPQLELAVPLPGGRRHVLSLSFVRDGDEFLARLETDGGHITELKNRSLDQLLTLVAGELEDLLA